jgi:hypothetical protein
VCWIHLIPVRSAVLQATTAPCLHLEPLELLSRDLMSAFVRTHVDFFIPVHPMRPHRRHVFASHRHDFVSATSPTCRSGACETWVPMGPHRQGPEGPCQVGPTCQKPHRPISGPRDLIRNPDDLGRLWTTLSRLRKTCRACGANFSLDCGGGPDEGPPTLNGKPSMPAI